jgi:hypothetical protein
VQVVFVPELVAAAGATNADRPRVAQRFAVVLPTGHDPGVAVRRSAGRGDTKPRISPSKA